MQAYLLNVWTILLDLAPWLLLGAAIAGALRVVVPSSFIVRHLGGRGWWSTVKAAVIGVPMPLCSCSVIPTGLGLYRQGAGKGAAVSYLTSTPQIGIDSVLVSASMLGWPFAVFKMFSALVMGIVAGGVTNAVTPATAQAAPMLAPPVIAPPVLAPLGAKVASCDEGEAPVAPVPPWWRQAWNFAVDDLLRMIWRWLALGVLISAGLTLWLEPGSLATMTDLAPIWLMLATLAVSLPLYVCATASVPIAAALVAAGFPTGAALVFLMAGPATNVATLGAVGRVLGWRCLLVYLLTIIIGSVGLGLAYDTWIALESVSLHEHQHGLPGSLGEWVVAIAAVFLLGLMLRFAVADLRGVWQRLSHRQAPASGSCCSPTATAALAPTTGCCGGSATPAVMATSSGCAPPVAAAQPAASCCGGAATTMAATTMAAAAPEHRPAR